MIISEKKASAALKPWWDIIYGHGLKALLGLGILLLFTTSQHTKIQDDVKETELNPKSSSVEAAGVSLEDNNRSTGFLSRVKRQYDQFPEGKVVPSLDDDVQFNDVVAMGELESDESVYTIYTLFLFVILWLLETLFSRLFYTSHLVQIICHILESLSDVREFRQVGQGLIFAGTIHHSHHKTHLWFIFTIHKILRLIFVLISLIVVAHFHVVDLSNPLASQLVTSRGSFSIGVLIILVLLLQLVVAVYSVLWSWVLANSPWGKLMKNYAIGLDKIDIARGRSVPGPPYVGGTSLRRNLKTISGLNLIPSSLMSYFMPPTNNRQKSTQFSRNQKRKLVKVVDSLNPYIASANVRLILDLIATRAGVGLALRCLSFLEMDVQNNWKPFKPVLQYISHDQNAQEPSHLNLIWRDPLAVLYLTPVPKELELHYGIEITFLKTNTKPQGEGLEIDDSRDQVVEIVGYDETRFFRNMNNRSAAGAGEYTTIQLESDKIHTNQRRHSRAMHWNPDIEAGSICSYSVLGGGDGSVSHLEESFTYREEFLDINEQDGDVNVVIWTIVDGQLIAKNTVSTYMAQRSDHQRVDCTVDMRYSENDYTGVTMSENEIHRIVIENSNETHEDKETEDAEIEHTSHDTDEVYDHIGSSSSVRKDDISADNEKGGAANDEIELEIIKQNDEDDVFEDGEAADCMKSSDETECVKDESSPKSSNEDLENDGVVRTQRHSILVETPSSTSSDGDFKSNKLEEEGRKRPKVKVRRKCLRTQSTSELPQLTNGGLTKGIRRVHSSSSFYRMTALEETDRYAQGNLRMNGHQNLPTVVICEPETQDHNLSISTISDNSIASSCNPCPIPVIREEGGSINEAFVNDTESDNEESTNAKTETLEMLI